MSLLPRCICDPFEFGLKPDSRCPRHAGADSLPWIAEPVATSKPLEGQKAKSALQHFNENMGDGKETPLGRLQYFCAIALNGQDWLDVEPFFDAVRSELEALRVDAARYEFASKHFVLSGGNNKKFNWPIAPATPAEWSKYLDAAIKESKHD